MLEMMLAFLFNFGLSFYDTYSVLLHPPFPTPHLFFVGGHVPLSIWVKGLRTQTLKAEVKLGMHLQKKVGGRAPVVNGISQFPETSNGNCITMKIFFSILPVPGL